MPTCQGLDHLVDGGLYVVYSGEDMRLVVVVDGVPARAQPLSQPASEVA